jgi:hypothetical protein
MKVLVACEESQTVTKAFRAVGHEAYSCDIKPPSGGRPDWHLLIDARALLNQEWDLMIAFPPCTHLASSGARYFEEKRKDGRQQRAIDFFLAFAHAPIPRIAIENPVGIMSTVWRKPDQYIQPYEFGHPESKKTGLWLKNLPYLRPTKICEPEYYTLPDGTVYRDKKGKRYSKTHYFSGRMQARWRNQTPSGQNRLGPSATRAQVRGRTYQGIADAMAKQWGSLGPFSPGWVRER